MNAEERSDFTQGSILKKMIPFMMPILGALILQAAYGAVDLLVVGRFGTTAGLSAVSTGSQILNLVTFVITQLAMGITVLIARYIGEKHTSQIGELLGGATTVFTMIAVILLVVMVFFAKPLAVLMQAPQEALMITSVYVRICQQDTGVWKNQGSRSDKKADETTDLQRGHFFDNFFNTGWIASWFSDCKMRF